MLASKGNIVKRTTAIVGLMISALVIILILSEVSSENVGAQAASAVTVGNASVGELVFRFSTDKSASRFGLAQNGTMQSISVYFSTSRFSAKAAIYTDFNGSPSTLIVRSASEQINSIGWHTFALPPNSLFAGGYWFAIVCSSSRASGAYTLGSQTNQHCVVRTGYSREFTAKFGTSSTFDNRLISIYGTFMPSAPTPQLTYGIHWDQNCTNETTSINWGALEPGSARNATVYVKNEGNVALTLSKSLANWSPSNATTYITLAWDYANSTLTPGSVLKLTLTLSVSPNAQSLGAFSFDTAITATENST